MKLYIKNMVCNRCIMAVEHILKELKIPFQSVTLGEADLLKEPTKEQHDAFSAELQAIGFELIDDRKSRLIEKIKTLVIEQVRKTDEILKVNLSDYLADQLHYDYKYLSGLFSEVEGTTIEKFCIAQKIERVKELLVYDELSLSEIAFKMGYSSVAHLSNQFKKITGLTPSHFRFIRTEKRKSLDQV